MVVYETENSDLNFLIDNHYKSIYKPVRSECSSCTVYWTETRMNFFMIQFVVDLLLMFVVVVYQREYYLFTQQILSF